MVPERLVALFTTDPGVIEDGSLYLRIIAFAQIGQTFEIVLEGALAGAGYTLWPMLVGTVSPHSDPARGFVVPPTRPVRDLAGVVSDGHRAGRGQYGVLADGAHGAAQPWYEGDIRRPTV